MYAAKCVLFLMAVLVASACAVQAQERIKMCGRDLIRLAVSSCGNSRLRRSIQDVQPEKHQFTSQLDQIASTDAVHMPPQSDEEKDVLFMGPHWYPLSNRIRRAAGKISDICSSKNIGSNSGSLSFTPTSLLHNTTHKYGLTHSPSYTANPPTIIQHHAHNCKGIFQQPGFGLSGQRFTAECAASLALPVPDVKEGAPSHLLHLSRASTTVTPTLTVICHLNGAFRACVLYLGPPSLHDLRGSSFLSPTAFNDRRRWERVFPVIPRFKRQDAAMTGRAPILSRRLLIFLLSFIIIVDVSSARREPVPPLSDKRYYLVCLCITAAACTGHFIILCTLLVAVIENTSSQLSVLRRQWTDIQSKAVFWLYSDVLRQVLVKPTNDTSRSYSVGTGRNERVSELCTAKEQPQRDEAIKGMRQRYAGAVHQHQIHDEKQGISKQSRDPVAPVFSLPPPPSSHHRDRTSTSAAHRQSLQELPCLSQPSRRPVHSGDPLPLACYDTTERPSHRGNRNKSGRITAQGDQAQPHSRDSRVTDPVTQQAYAGNSSATGSNSSKDSPNYGSSYHLWPESPHKGEERIRIDLHKDRRETRTGDERLNTCIELLVKMLRLFSAGTDSKRWYNRITFT
ncbi:hypothetical protein PAMA_005216 [Pampus argenteus]